MTEHLSRSRPQIPEPEDSGPKEVYAFFGLCSYCGQVLEQGLINFAVVLQARGATRVTRSDVEAAFNSNEGKTLGQLIKDVKRLTPVSAALEAALSTSLKDRNYLAHRFFATHDVDFASDAGRSDMIRELREVTRRFQEADGMVDAISLPLWAALGLTEEMVEKELARVRAEASKRDGAR